jgi:hypothetical protein
MMAAARLRVESKKVPLNRGPLLETMLAADKISSTSEVTRLAVHAVTASAGPRGTSAIAAAVETRVSIAT